MEPARGKQLLRLGPIQLVQKVVELTPPEGVGLSQGRQEDESGEKNLKNTTTFGMYSTYMYNNSNLACFFICLTSLRAIVDCLLTGDLSTFDSSLYMLYYSIILVANIYEVIGDVSWQFST